MFCLFAKLTQLSAKYTNSTQKSGALLYLLKIEFSRIFYCKFLISPGWIFDETNDFRYVFYTGSGLSLLAAVILNISSRVRVEKELSLVQKSKGGKEHDVSSELTESQSGMESDTKLVYETAV